MKTKETGEGASVRIKILSLHRSILGRVYHLVPTLYQCIYVTNGNFGVILNSWEVYFLIYILVFSDLIRYLPL